MKRLALSLSLLLVTVLLWAAPARRGTRIVKQPDGTRLCLSVCGDEWLHYEATASGAPVQCDPVTGWWREAPLDAEVVEQARAARAAYSAQCAKRASRRVAAERRATKSVTKRGLVILAEFQDVRFTTSDAQAVYHAMFNEVGYSDHGMGGSVRDYFLAQSYGQLDIDFDVVGPVLLPGRMAYYGANNSKGTDARRGAFVRDAVMGANALVDYSHYDWDGDGEVDQVYIIYAGFGESFDPNNLKDTIWPHAWTLDAAIGNSMTLDGVTIDTYACSNELYGTSGTRLDGIGTACHEFSHCLGLPDMYDIQYSGNFGMDAWDVMDYGLYNADSYVPCSYTAYERMYCGWVKPTVLDRPCRVDGMTNIDDCGECYIIYNDAHADEYYILQNIQRTGWNSAAATSGMLVIHVDYSSFAWANNSVNITATRQRMTPVCADNDYRHSTLKGDLWPYGDKTELTDTSLPAALLYNPASDGRKLLGHPITAITHEGGLVSFAFDGGGDDAVTWPNALTAPHQAYDLAGRAATHVTRPGIYLTGGRKVLVR